MLEFVIDNWEVLGLLLTNILAWFKQPPKIIKKEK